MPHFTDRPPVEDRLVALLRDRAERIIEERGLDWAATRLDISVPGVKALLWKRRWTVEKAVHVAGCLEVLTDTDIDRLAAPHSAAS